MSFDIAQRVKQLLNAKPPKAIKGPSNASKRYKPSLTRTAVDQALSAEEAAVKKEEEEARLQKLEDDAAEEERKAEREVKRRRIEEQRPILDARRKEEENSRRKHEMREARLAKVLTPEQAVHCKPLQLAPVHDQFEGPDVMTPQQAALFRARLADTMRMREIEQHKEQQEAEERERAEAALFAEKYKTLVEAQQAREQREAIEEEERRHRLYHPTPAIECATSCSAAAAATESPTLLQSMRNAYVQLQKPSLPSCSANLAMFAIPVTRITAPFVSGAQIRTPCNK